MTVDPKDQTSVCENANREADLSRRGFLAGLTILAVGGAATVAMPTNEAMAAVESDSPGKAKGPTDNEAVAEGKKVELAQNVDPNDPMQAFAQPYYRHRRRVVRRVVRRERRVVRRVRRRVY